MVLYFHCKSFRRWPKMALWKINRLFSRCIFKPGFPLHLSVLSGNPYIVTLLGTDISPEKSILKMIILFPRWNMFLPLRVLLKLSATCSFWLIREEHTHTHTHLMGPKERQERFHLGIISDYFRNLDGAPCFGWSEKALF